MDFNCLLVGVSRRSVTGKLYLVGLAMDLFWVRSLCAGFLNADDEDYAEDEECMPSAEQTNFLENSGWSSRSRSVFLMWFFIPWGDATVFTLGFLSAVFYCRNLIDLVSDHDIFPVRYVVSCWPILSICCTRSMTTARIRVSSRWYCCDHLHCYLHLILFIGSFLSSHWCLKYHHLPSGVLVCRSFTLFFACRAVAKYLQLLFEKEAEHGRKVLPMDNLLVGKTRKEASRMFFEALVRFIPIF